MNLTSLPSPTSSNPDKAESPIGYVLVPPKQPPGLNTGIGSLVFAVAALLYLRVTLPVALLAAFFTRSPSEAGPYDWIAPTVLWSLPALCGLVSLVLGTASVALARRPTPTGRHTKAWFTGIAGLGVLGLDVAIVAAWIFTTGRVMILF
ncbi:hypothetical protein VUN82_21780 [Micrococcaceae bacterium Sec5.1]